MSTIIELQDLISATSRQLSERQLPVSQILHELKNRHQDEIRNNSEELIDIALRQFIGAASRRRGRSAIEAPEGDLFSYFDLPQSISVDRSVDGMIQKTKVSFNKLLLPEAEAWITKSKKPKPRVSKRVLEAEELIEAVRSFMSDGMTLEEGWEAAIAAGAIKKAARG